MKFLLNCLYIFLIITDSFAQSQVTTTGNNVINVANPYAADIVIGSDAGTRHDASMMWWSNNSASRISNTSDVFYFSVWNTINSNIGLCATLGGSSFIMGNVGIGTMTPREALSVNGNIRAKQVKVETTNWPDYVFSKNFELPPLVEVKRYIDINHHLPEIPSAEEISRNDLNLGEMNGLLVKKVEELTLYLIEKDKQIADQQKVSQTQQRQIDALARQINAMLDARIKK